MIVCEPICDGQQHIPFNSSVLTHLAKRSKSRIIFLCANDYWSNLFKHLGKDKLRKYQHQGIEILDRQDNLKSWINSRKLLKKIKEISKPSELIVFTTTISGILDNCSCILSESSVFCFMHMVLARVDGHISRNPFTRWFSTRSVLARFRTQNTKIIVLEKHIKQNIVEIFPKLEDDILWFPHPLEVLECIKPKVLQASTKKIVICFPGGFNKEKGADSYLQLVSKLSNNTNFSFRCAGKSSKEFINEDFSNFEIAPGNKFLERKEFLRLLVESHFLFLGHEPSIYKWCASGVYLDALKLGIPIIARRSKFFEQEFGLYGKLGFLFEEIGQIINFLENGIKLKEYQIFCSNIANAKIQRKKDYVSKFDQILCKSGF